MNGCPYLADERIATRGVLSFAMLLGLVRRDSDLLGCEAKQHHLWLRENSRIIELLKSDRRDRLRLISDWSECDRAHAEPYADRLHYRIAIIGVRNIDDFAGKNPFEHRASIQIQVRVDQAWNQHACTVFGACLERAWIAFSGTAAPINYHAADLQSVAYSLYRNLQDFINANRISNCRQQLVCQSLSIRGGDCAFL